MCYSDWIDNGIISLVDLYDQNTGQFFTYNNFCNFYHIKTPFTVFEGLKKAIFKNWPFLKTLSLSSTEMGKYPQPLTIILENVRGVKNIYDIFTKHLLKKVSFKYIDKWNRDLEEDNIFESLNLEKINCLVFKITKDVKLRWLQYRFLHRILPTNILLHKMKIVVSPLCTFCNNELETYCHLFFECLHVRTFVSSLQEWIDNTCDAVCTINLKNILFGYPCKAGNIENIVFLLLKQYIYFCRYKNKKPCLIEFKRHFGIYYRAEKQMYKNNGTFLRRWLLWHSLFDV